MIEKTIGVTTSDGTMPTYVFHPEGEGPHPAVIFYFDIFGIRDEIKNMCRRFARAGYYAILPSLFYRRGNPSYNPEKFMSGNLNLENTDPLHPMNLNTSTTNALVIEDTGALTSPPSTKRNLKPMPNGSALSAPAWAVATPSLQRQRIPTTFWPLPPFTAANSSPMHRTHPISPFPNSKPKATLAGQTRMPARPKNTYNATKPNSPAVTSHIALTLCTTRYTAISSPSV